MDYKKIILDNGVKLITCHMPHTRSVSVLFFVTVGSCYESNNLAGISHFIEHMCFKGTQKRASSREISEAIEGVGGIMNGGTDREMTSYWCKLASQHFEKAVDVIVDLLRDPLFRSEDVDKERQVIIEEINMSLDSPQQRAGMLFDELMWPGGPMGRDVAGSKESVSAIDRPQMLKYLNDYYTPENILISIAGDVEDDRVISVVTRYTEDWKKGVRPDYISSMSDQKQMRMRMEYRDTEQVNMLLGVEGYSVFHPDRFTSDLLSMILGEGMSSRLFTEIREKLGLTYDIHSYVEHFRESGSFVIQAGIEPGQTVNTIRAVLGQLALMREGIPFAELNKAIEMAKGRLLLSMENSRNVAGWYGAQEILTGKIMTVDDVTQAIEKVTVADIQRVACQLFETDRVNLALVGPINEQDIDIEILKI
ncbi:MAG: insulinase family protein [Dehalococcoidia bacterium]|nr:insulinase family protein [Dehalococcoidia bacterium]